MKNRKLMLVLAVIGVCWGAVEARPMKSSSRTRVGGRPAGGAPARAGKGGPNYSVGKTVPAGRSARPGNGAGAGFKPARVDNRNFGGRGPSKAPFRMKPGRYHGMGVHHAPPPPRYHNWHRGPRHPTYRNCWYGDVWYDSVGGACYSPEIVVVESTPVVDPPTIVNGPPPATLVGWTNIGQHPYWRNCWDSNGIWYDGAGMMWQPPSTVVTPATY